MLFRSYTATGLVNGDLAAIITGSLTRATGEGAGSYAITQGTVAATANYALTYVGANLTITGTVAITITANAATKSYGATDPTLTGFTITSGALLSGDTISSVSATRVAGANVGTYLITPASAIFGVGSASNYTITYATGNFSITTAPLTVTADAKSKTIGTADPALTYTATGLVNGDLAPT